eukprot:13627-Karenia_brevis.AAC.1
MSKKLSRYQSSPIIRLMSSTTLLLTCKTSSTPLPLRNPHCASCIHSSDHDDTRAATTRAKSFVPTLNSVMPLH